MGHSEDEQRTKKIAPWSSCVSAARGLAFFRWISVLSLSEYAASLWNSEWPGHAPRSTVVVGSLDRLQARPVMSGFTAREGGLLR